MMEKISKKYKKDEAFILHNAGGKELKKTDYIVEMCQYKTKCFQCKTVIQKVRSLLDEIKNIKKNEVLGICVHCKRANPLGKCRRCEYIVDKFLCDKVKRNEERQNSFKLWLFKLNQLLNSILEGNVCRHKLYTDATSALELEKLLHELKTPLEMRQPEMVAFPTDPDPFSSITQSKEMLEELLLTLKSESVKRRSSDSLFVSPSKNATSCICKYFGDKTYEENRSMKVLTQTTPFVDPNLESKIRDRINVSREFIDRPKSETQPKTTKIKETHPKEKRETKTLKAKTEGIENVSPDADKVKKSNKSELKKPTLSPEEQLMLKMMKDREKEKKVKEKAIKKEKVKEFAKIESLPELIIREVIEVVEERSESIVECDHKYNGHPTVMIRNSKVVPFDPRHKDEPPEGLAPLLYKIKTVCPEPLTKPSTASATPTTSSGGKENKTKSKHRDQDDLLTKGVIKYALSDREFIEKGWTVLPTTKIMRRMNIYKMEAACPKYDWFERHKNRKNIFYDTGEKLAEIDCFGHGKWFYKNGMVALDYYNAQELNAGQRYVIYSSGEEIHNGKKTPITVLASFDYLGNGIVYDIYGHVPISAMIRPFLGLLKSCRLKYNQTEGMVLDDKIGAPGRWKWHSLNEPPILQPVFIDTHVEYRSACIDKLLKNDRLEGSRHARESNAEMLAIEFDNFVKEKAHKLLQKFKPFQIKMKVLKLNEHFSLRVLDQSNIYLLFRDGKVSMKLNLGMLLISSEIVDTITAEVSEVATPYDRYPPKSESVAEIQRTLNKARKVGRAHTTNIASAGKSISSKNSN